MINVQEIRRNVINVVKNYSDAQVKVRKATSNEPWGPSATQMAEIADLTYNVVAISEIMQIIWKRLNDHGKNWRHVYKALVLLEYLIKTGSDKVTQQCRDNLFAIQTLKDFQYFEESKDQGLSIREKSKMLVNLLKDDERLKIERSRAMKAKERFSQSISCLDSGESGEQTFRQSSSYPESLSDGATSRQLNSDLESARPQTAGEEKLQLELALAMSKEEAEQEERLRKNDDIRLKLALEESEKNAKPKSESAVDELLSLNTTIPSSTSASAVLNSGLSNKMNNDPWSGSLLPSPPTINKKSASLIPSNDPWSPTLDPIQDQNTSSSNTFLDPWATAPSAPALPKSNDPWALNNDNSNGPTLANNDPWDLSSNNQATTAAPKIEALYESIKPQNQPLNNSQPVRRTPESFLGPNSNLVNLDALVSSSKAQTASSPSNPFASAMNPVTVNPFQANKPSQPTINELRAQTNNSNNLLGSSIPVFNNSSFTPIYPQLPSLTNNTTTTSNNNNSNSNVWGNFPSTATTISRSAFSSTTSSNMIQSTPNNPFAM